MLLINSSIILSITFFFTLLYITFLKSLLLYLLPVSFKANFSSSKNNFYIINQKNIKNITTTFLFILLTLLSTISLPSTSLWFNHIIITQFQTKFIFLIIFTFYFVSSTLYSYLYFSSKEIYDFIITFTYFFYWIILLFMSNSFFSVIFNIEVLSTLIFTLHITSVFSTSYSYKNLDLSFSYLFQYATPHTFLNSLLFFYWMSLISSLNLFVFLVIFYLNFFSFDWYIIEVIFTYLINTNSFSSLLSLHASWLVLIICIFLKCGVAPLFIWKPAFFKGLSFHTIFVYITFFYFFLFFFIIHLISSLSSYFLVYYTYVMLIMSILGSLMLISFIFEGFYLKTFLATSSILNSLFIFIAITSINVTDSLFWL